MEGLDPQASAGADAADVAPQSAPSGNSFGLDIVSALFDEPEERLKQETPSPAPKPAGEAAARESASAGKPAASKPADEKAEAPKATDPKPESATANAGAPEAPKDGAEEQPKPTRGQSAHERHEAEKDAIRAEAAAAEARATELKAAVDAAIKERDDAAAALRAREAAEAASRERYATLIGDDAEYERRQRISARMFDPNYDGPTLTNDEALELARWTAGRELREPFVQDGLSQGQRYAQEILGARQVQWVEGFNAVAAEIGFDPSTAPHDATPADLIRHAAAPLLERISQLEAALTTANDRAVAAEKPVVSMGGRSGVTVPDDVWDPTQSVDRNLDRALWGGS